LIGPTWLIAVRIGLEQDTHMGQSLRGGLAVLREFEQLRAFFRLEFDNVLFVHEVLLEFWTLTQGYSNCSIQQH
jgi:hypothetical protein